MTDLTSRLPGGSADEGDDRGQLLLVGAIATALVIITIAVLVNTTIYTGSIAPQAPDIAGQEGERYERIIDRDLQRLSNEIDENSSAPGADQSELAENVTRYSHRLSVIAAQESPAVVNVTFNETISDGPTGVADQSPGQVEGRPPNRYDFDIIDPANASRVTSFNIKLDSTTAASEPQAFSIIVENTAATPTQRWVLKFFKENVGMGTTVFRVEERTGPTGGTLETQCDFPDGGPKVKANETTVTNTQAGGSTSCSIQFARTVDPPYTVSVEKGNKANGATWSLATEGDVNSEEFFSEDSGNNPFINKYVTNAAFNVIYQTPSISYNRTIQLDVGDPVAPESGHVFLYSDFESASTSTGLPAGSNLGPDWVTGTDSGTGGQFGISNSVSYSGSQSAFHNGDTAAATGLGDGNGTIETQSTYDTSKYDAVVVEFWAQEGRAVNAPDGGPEVGEDEALRVQYYNGTDWVTAGRIEPFDQTGDEDNPRQYHRNVRIDDPDALDTGVRFRFLLPADATSDRWFIDDVVLRGWLDR